VERANEQGGERQGGERQGGTTGIDASPEVAGATWDCMANWTQAERDYWFMGPFDGGMPGMVRRIRRILDVSQRGLAAILEVSQSVVARWETGRTSPRLCVVERLLRMARLKVTVRDEKGEEVGPMRADGARTHRGSRYPAHVDLRATGWWVPRRLRSMTSIEAYAWRERSKKAGDPAVRYTVSPFWKEIERELRGTPDDHPALEQLAAEVRFLDEQRDTRRRTWAA
jgi:transcriptional regulator with XRE-family HTH domain